MANYIDKTANAPDITILMTAFTDFSKVIQEDSTRLETKFEDLSIQNQTLPTGARRTYASVLSGSKSSSDFPCRIPHVPKRCHHPQPFLQQLVRIAREANGGQRNCT